MFFFNKKFKVAIIGGGTIGLYLAWKLSKKNCQVVLFEKNSKAGEKACTTLVSLRINEFLPVKEELIENKIDFSLINFPKKRIKLELKPQHLVINRQKLDNFLYKLAESNGVEINFNTKINEIPSGFDYVIGCDGALSVIRKKLSLPAPIFKSGIQYILKEKNFSNYVEVWPFKKGGFFWKVPRGEKTEYGVMGRGENLLQEFEAFLKKRNIKEKKGEKKFALIPQGLILPKHKNITLCGDALGLTKPWSGGGIIWGLKASDILLKTFPDFLKYRKELKKFFWWKIEKGKVLTQLVYFLGFNFPFFLPSQVSRDNDFPFF